MLLKIPHRQFLFLLTIVLGIEFVVLAIAPTDRKDWLLENVLVVLFVGAMYGSYRKLMLSRISFGGDLGQAYLGTQGDVWDAHKDMAFASLGALIAKLITAGINIRLQRDFADEWNESLRVKDSRPLGEDEMRRLLKRNETA